MLKTLSLVSLLIAFGCASGAERHARWTSLFNGKDLAGWTVKCQPQDKEKSFWSVDRGSILCDSMGRKNHNYVWLVSDKEYANFEVKLKFQAYKDSPGNSGLQFRSRFDEAGGWLDGPQVDIHPPAGMPWRTGLIYDETRGEQRWISPSLKNAAMDPKFQPAAFIFKYAGESDGWNDLTLIADGTRIKTILNGVTMTDWDGAGVLDNAAHAKHNSGLRGHFALQLHSGDELKIRYKDISLHELP